MSFIINIINAAVNVDIRVELAAGRSSVLVSLGSTPEGAFRSDI